MQNLINSAQKSNTQQLYNDIGTVIPFYKENPSLPPLGTQWHNQYPTIGITGAIADRSVLLDLPSGGGFLYDMSIRCLCTGKVEAQDIAVGVYPGLNMVRAFQWESGGKIFIYKTKNALWSQLKQEQNETMKIFSFAYARALNSTTEELATVNAPQYLTYIPVLESFLTKPEKLLLLDNMKNLKLRIFFDTQAASGLVNAVTGIDISIIAQTYQPKLSVFDEMKLKDWTNSFVMEMVNMDEEIFPLDSATTSRLQINTPFLVAKSHLFIRKINNAVSSTGAHTYGLPTWKINTVYLNLNGQVFLDGTIPVSRLASAAARYGNTSLDLGAIVAATGAVGQSTGITFNNDMITFDWGILCGRNMNSGTAFFNELRGSFINITYNEFPGAGGDTYTDYSAYLEHEYFEGTTYNPGSNGNGGTLSVTHVG